MKGLMSIAAGIAAGVAVGTAVGITVSRTGHKSRTKMGKITSMALDAMGEAFHSVADIIK